MNLSSKDFIGSKAILIILHVAGCTLFLFSPFFFGPPGHDRFPGQETMQLRMILDNVILALFFYLNLFFLLPKILAPYGWARYAAVLVLSYAVFALISYLIRDFLRPDFGMMRPDFDPEGFVPDDGPRFKGGGPRLDRGFRLEPFFMHFPFLMAWALSTSIKFSLDFVRTERERKERENESLKSELSLLRSQISPHFMFNVLNSLTALARKKSDELEPIIIKLSQLMRYMLYDSEIKKVSLETETEYLENYIDLQKLRFGSSIDVHFDQKNANHDFYIEPMLLIPFVENAFKHGTGMIDKPEILISIDSEEKNLKFTVKNKYNPESEEKKDATHGIGLQNVKRRLELLYPGKYSLNINKENNWFSIELNLLGE
jgi:two-component system LytT family sensor kinase